MNGLLNEITQTVHRQQSDGDDPRSICGATTHLDPNQLEETTVSKALDDEGADRCGRCFEDGGGY